MSQANQPIPTIVIVNFNGGEHILECLDALQGQTVSPSRIVVVDNASTDDSVPRVKAAFPSTEILPQTENLGFAAGNNAAFDVLQDETWVILLNPDTVAEPGWLEALLAARERNPEVEVFTSKLVNAADPQTIDGAGDAYHVSGLSWRRYHGRHINDAVKYHDPVFSPCAAAALFRLQKIREVGGFDETYFCYNEDVDLMFRLRLLGSHCEYVENSVVAHVGSGLTGRDSDFSVYYGHRNLVWTYVKNMPGWRLWWYLPQHLLLNLVSIVVYTARGRGRVICRAKWHALTGLSQALRKRNSIQSARTVEGGQIVKFMTKGILRPYLSRFG